MEKIDTDLGLRHSSETTESAFIQKYCEVFRPHCVVSEDDSFNELEKSITHVLNVKIAQGELQTAMGLEKLCVWDAREAMEDIPTDETLTSLLANAKDALRPAQEHLEGMLQSTEMGGHSSPEEITAMARFLTFTLVTRGE